MKFNNRPNNCHIVEGKELWESRSVAVVGVVIANCDGDDYVLIGKRGSGLPDKVGFWNVPCGYLDWDETGPQAVYREIFEETGFNIQEAFSNYIPNNNIVVINAKLTSPFYVNTGTNEPRQNVSLSYGVYFSCVTLPELTTEYSEPNEVEETKWIKLSEINNYKFAFNHDGRIRHYWDKFVKK